MSKTCDKVNDSHQRAAKNYNRTEGSPTLALNTMIVRRSDESETIVLKTTSLHESKPSTVLKNNERKIVG